jgi:hypothetical protein
VQVFSRSYFVLVVRALPYQRVSTSVIQVIIADQDMEMAGVLLGVETRMAGVHPTVLIACFRFRALGGFFSMHFWPCCGGQSQKRTYESQPQQCEPNLKLIPEMACESPLAAPNICY